jgi:hypothetical protein
MSCAVVQAVIRWRCEHVGLTKKRIECVSFRGRDRGESCHHVDNELDSNLESRLGEDLIEVPHPGVAVRVREHVLGLPAHPQRAMVAVNEEGCERGQVSTGDRTPRPRQALARDDRERRTLRIMRRTP